MDDYTGIGTDIGLYASGTFEGLGSPSGLGISVSWISGWFAGNVGRLNVLIETNYQTVSGFIIPALSNVEVAIFDEMFANNYYTRLMSNNLGASAYDWSEVSEEGSTVRRVSKNEIAKTYMQLVKNTDENIKDLVGHYRRNKAKPLSVTGDDDILTLPSNSTYSAYFPYMGYYYFRVTF